MFFHQRFIMMTLEWTSTLSFRMSHIFNHFELGFLGETYILIKKATTSNIHTVDTAGIKNKYDM